MITLDSPEELSQLPLSKTLFSAVRHEIEQPFGSITAATAFWKDVGTSLLFIEEGDDLNNLAKYDDGLAFTLEYPEWTLDLTEGYQLSLAIFNDEGSGHYLLCPSHLIKKDTNHGNSNT